MSKVRKHTIKEKRIKIYEKGEIIQKFQAAKASGLSARAFAREINLPQSTLRGIIKDQDQIQEKINELSKSNATV